MTGVEGEFRVRIELTQLPAGQGGPAPYGKWHMPTIA